VSFLRAERDRIMPGKRINVNFDEGTWAAIVAVARKAMF
jgi:hypothetical protein